MTGVGQRPGLAVALAMFLCLSVAADDHSSHSAPPHVSEGKQPINYTICSRLVLRTQVSTAISGEPPRRQTLIYQQHFACPIIHPEVECCGLPGNQHCCREEDFIEPRQRLTAGLFTAGALVLLALLCFAGPAICCLGCRCPRSRRGAGAWDRRSGTLPATSPVVVFRTGDAEEAETGQVDLLTDRRLRRSVTRDGAAPHPDYGAAAKTSPTATTATTVEDEILPPPPPPPTPPPPPPPLQQSPNLLPSNLPPPPYPGL